MRRLLYILLGLLLFAGAAGFLYARQMQVAEAPSASQPPASGPATRSLGSGDRKSVGASDRSERRIDRGIEQYKRPDGSWEVFQAAIDVLNIIVGIIGISLAMRGMRGGKSA